MMALRFFYFAANRREHRFLEIIDHPTGRAHHPELNCPHADPLIRPDPGKLKRGLLG
jgi:hypothetical protein